MWENITSSTRGDATWEIIIMLLGAFILGYLLRMLLGKKTEDHTEELERLRSDNKRLQADLDACKKKSSGLQVDLDACRAASDGFKAEAATAAASLAALQAIPQHPSDPDDLKKIEGIGPKIESLLNEGGIYTWAALADAKQERLLEILHAHFTANMVHKPDTWPAQAALARDGKWDELTKWQDELKGGV